MASTYVIKLPRNIAEKLKEAAEKAGVTLEEYILELILHDYDPKERAREYIVAAENLVEQAYEELDKGDLRQAAEKLWGATALAIKAYADWKDGVQLKTHGELWRYRRVLENELGEWVYTTWMIANGMHTCFYEDWCSREDVEKACIEIKKLVEEIKKRIQERPGY